MNRTKLITTSLTSDLSLFPTCLVFASEDDFFSRVSVCTSVLQSFLYKYHELVHDQVGRHRTNANPEAPHKYLEFLLQSLLQDHLQPCTSDCKHLQQNLLQVSSARHLRTFETPFFKNELKHIPLNISDIIKNA